MLPRPLDYLTYYGFWLNRRRCQALTGLSTLRALGASRGVVDPMIVDAATDRSEAVGAEVQRWTAFAAEAAAAARVQASAG